jgi:hypothetical protein
MSELAFDRDVLVLVHDPAGELLPDFTPSTTTTPTESFSSWTRSGIILVSRMVSPSRKIEACATAGQLDELHDSLPACALYEQVRAH